MGDAGFEHVLLLVQLVTGVQTWCMHASAPANENTKLLTKILKESPEVG